MKIRKLPKYDIDVITRGPFQDGHNVVIDLGFIPLGNNFTYGHIFDNLTPEQADFLYYADFGIDDDIRLIARTNCGTMRIDTCGNDIADHIRSL